MDLMIVEKQSDKHKHKPRKGKPKREDKPKVHKPRRGKQNKPSRGKNRRRR